MKNKFIILFIGIIFFVGMSSISAEDNLVRTETKNKIMFIKDKDGKFIYSWSFNKDNYKEKDFSFNMDISNNSPFKSEINSLLKNNIKKEYVSFLYHGNLPSVATIKIKTKKFKDGDRLNLYYYNEKTSKIEKIKGNMLVKNGYVSFDIKHCSDYFLSLSIVKEATNEKNNNGVVIIGMICVIVALVGYTMFKNKE